MPPWFYEKNTELIESPLNKTFEDVLGMAADEFRQWVVDLRKFVVYLWDEKNLPPRVGYNEAEIAEQFSQIQEMQPFELQSFECDDEYTGEHNIFRCTLALGNAVNQFFPTMMKTRINYTKEPDSGKSIYDYFADPDLLDTFLTYATRHFKRDSFYNYSLPIKINDIKHHRKNIPVAKTGSEWVLEFEERYRKRNRYDYWLAPKEKEETYAYTGYNEALRGTTYLRLSRKEIEKFDAMIPYRSRSNVNWNKSESYVIRAFPLGQRLFPIGLKAFRVSFCQYAVNFPPVVAKYIYEKYTEQWRREKNIFVWDPSAGWGGRLIGALSVEENRHVIYLANDPNTDHNTTPGRTKYHEIYDFYCSHVRKGGLWNSEHTGFQFWQKGSEEMQFDPRFQKMKGKLSLVFTSPPYFSKEAYSQDDTQSYKKFSSYELWRDGFLKETLKTAVEWLRPGGYLVWNIADASFGGEILPLELDSRHFLEGFGMQYVETIKMALAQMPGGNRIDADTGLPKFKNFCKSNGLWLKYEPLFVFQKPKA